MNRTEFPAERTAVVTGAASEHGIGGATAQRLAADGWSIAIVDIDGEAAEEAATRISADHDCAAVGVMADVSDQASVDRAVSDVERQLPPIAGLANIAGISSATPFMEVTPEEWDRVLAIDLKGVYLMTQRALRGMIERRFGRIVSISSVSAQRGGGSYSKVAYSAAKAGVIGLTRAVAREMGEYGITVNCIAPGPIDTDIMGGTLTEERKVALSEGILVQRVGTREEVAALIAFLMGPDAGFITAATYDINGGLQAS